MTGWWWAAVLLGLLALVGFFLSARAGRLDRLHLRLDASRDALDAHLARRAGVALELSASGLLDPATSMAVAEAAEVCVSTTGAGPSDADESALSQVLRVVLDDAGGAAELSGSVAGRSLLAELTAATERVVFARRFHNDAVAAVQQMRRRKLVRWFRLAGHAAWPQPFDIDDAPPHF